LLGCLVPLPLSPQFIFHSLADGAFTVSLLHTQVGNFNCVFDLVHQPYSRAFALGCNLLHRGHLRPQFVLAAARCSLLLCQHGMQLLDLCSSRVCLIPSSVSLCLCLVQLLSQQSDELVRGRFAAGWLGRGTGPYARQMLRWRGKLVQR
jgi:hypothetical protein